MAEHHRERDQEQQHKDPSTLQILAVATLFPVGGVLLCLAGLTLAGTLVGFAVMTPLFVIFSPVLVPAAITFALAVAGFLTSGAFGITALSSLSWIFNYMRQMRGTLSEHLEHAKRRMQDTAGHPSMAEHHRDRDQKQQDTAGHPSMAEHHRDRDKKQQGTAGHPSMAEHHRDRDLKQQHPTDVIKSMLPHKGPSTSQVLAVATLFPVGGGLLCLAGMTLAGTVVGLAVTTPLFVIFSPVLVPAALTFATAVAGFLTSGAFGITALSSFSSIVNYMRQIRGTLQEHLEHAKRRMAGHGG